MTESTHAWGHGLATSTLAGAVLDCWFPAPALGVAPTGVEPAAELVAGEMTDELRGVETRVVLAETDLAQPPADTIDAYLRLHLLSHRLVKPRSINLDGIFGVLPNVVWTTTGRARWTASSRPVPGCAPPAASSPSSGSTSSPG